MQNYLSGKEIVTVCLSSSLWGLLIDLSLCSWRQNFLVLSLGTLYLVGDLGSRVQIILSFVPQNHVRAFNLGPLLEYPMAQCEYQVTEDGQSFNCNMCIFPRNVQGETLFGDGVSLQCISSCRFIEQIAFSQAPRSDATDSKKCKWLLVRKSNRMLLSVQFEVLI